MKTWWEKASTEERLAQIDGGIRPIHASLLQNLHYCPDTGAFTWRKDSGTNKLAGKRAGTLCNGYVTISINKRFYRAHRLAWASFHGASEFGFIDHINGDRSDNRISNLRECTVSQNQINRRQTVGSLPRGVFWSSTRKKFLARIKLNGKSKQIGTFTSSEDAAAAYDKAASEMFGEFYTNGVARQPPSAELKFEEA